MNSPDAISTPAPEAVIVENPSSRKTPWGWILLFVFVLVTLVVGAVYAFDKKDSIYVSILGAKNNDIEQLPPAGTLKETLKESPDPANIEALPPAGTLKKV